MTTPPAPDGAETRPYEPAREWSPSSKIDWTRTDRVLSDCLERRRLLMLHTVASEDANEGLPPIPNCPDGTAVFLATERGESRFVAYPNPWRIHVCRRGRLWRKRARRVT